MNHLKTAGKQVNNDLFNLQAVPHNRDFETKPSIRKTSDVQHLQYVSTN